jgi:hypothetical protein
MGTRHQRERKLLVGDYHCNFRAVSPNRSYVGTLDQVDAFAEVATLYFLQRAP